MHVASVANLVENAEAQAKVKDAAARDVHQLDDEEEEAEKEEWNVEAKAWEDAAQREEEEEVANEWEVESAGVPSVVAN